jgi:acetylornithine deacetylase/succinyl-diaminopimelate desuccinylase-like protein
MVSLEHERLLRHIDEHQASYLERWEQLRAYLSEQHKPQSRQAAKASTINDQLLLQLQHRGIHTTLLNNDSSFIYSELDSKATHTLLFYHHYNLNLPGIWELLPIAIGLLTLDVYRECTGTLPVNIKWLFHTSSKPDVSELHSIVEEHLQQLQADGCLWNRHSATEEGVIWPLADDRPLLLLGIRGLLCVELATHTTTNPVPSHYGSIVPNAAWRLLWALNSLKDAREEIRIEGFYDTLAPIEDEALASLYTLPDTASTLARQWGMKNLLLGLQGFQMHYAHLLTPTCTINFMTGGDGTSSSSAPTFPLPIPSQARAQVDFYLVPGQEPDEIFTLLQHHLNSQGFSDIETRLLYRCPPAYTPLANSFVQLICNATARAYGQAPLILPIQPESHPLSLLQHLTDMPILVTTSGGTQSASQSREHFDVTSGLIGGLKQTVLIMNALSRI